MSLSTTFVDPKAVMQETGMLPGNIVADFGCGAGFFSIESARIVGDEGRVYALDVLPSALEAIESQAKALGLRNIVATRVNIEREEGSKLPPNSVDWVIAKDVFFQNQNRDIMMREIARILKSGGQALIMEWNPDDMGIGPEVSVRVSRDELKSLATATGLSIDRNILVGAFHYAFVVKKA